VKRMSQSDVKHLGSDSFYVNIAVPPGVGHFGVGTAKG
jgi:hypothetical protein